MMIDRSFPRHRLALAAALLLAGAGTSAHAEDRSFACAAGSWTTSACWSPTGVPKPGDSVRLGNVLVTMDKGVRADLAQLTVRSDNSALQRVLQLVDGSLATQTLQIDQGLLHPCITNLYHHNMQYDDNMDIKGDARVVARGAMAMVMREQLSAKRTEFLQLTANPIDLQIMGPEGRAVILRSKARELGSEERKAVPDTEELAARLAAQEQQALQQQQLELKDRQSTGSRQPRKPQP